jgi:hypothetical protein
MPADINGDSGTAVGSTVKERSKRVRIMCGSRAKDNAETTRVNSQFRMCGKECDERGHYSESEDSIKILT